MDAVLPVEYVDFDLSVEETGTNLFHCNIQHTAITQGIAQYLSALCSIGDISQMSAEEYLSWVR